MIRFTHLKNDINGNPRYVCHFLDLLSSAEHEKLRGSGLNVYEVALKRAKTLGGKKFHNKQYGGGIVFQCFNVTELQRKILQLQDSVKVKFYQEKFGEILAVFPEMLENKGLTCYSRIGQHGVTSKQYLRTLKRVSHPEIDSILTELISLGYKLEILN